MHIFYNKSTLKDTLVARFNDKPITSRKTIKDCVLFFNDKEISGVNITNVSKNIKLAQGLLYPSADVINYIETIAKIKIPMKNNWPYFTIGKVKSCEIIPNTHLHLCQVDVKSEILQIVCGAQNVRNDITVVVAPVGVAMPNGLVIKPGKIMNHKSCGMLCSAKELMISLSKDTLGIIELDGKYVVGELYPDPYVNLKK